MSRSRGSRSSRRKGEPAALSQAPAVTEAASESPAEEFGAGIEPKKYESVWRKLGFRVVPHSSEKLDYLIRCARRNLTHSRKKKPQTRNTILGYPCWYRVQIDRDLLAKMPDCQEAVRMKLAGAEAYESPRKSHLRQLAWWMLGSWRRSGKKAA